jgi:CubicO group peptidase (beta-lactamase class C family)
MGGSRWRRRLLLFAVSAVGGAAWVYLLVVIVMLALWPEPRFVARMVFWGDSDVWDHDKFPARAVASAPPAFRFRRAVDEAAVAARFAGATYRHHRQPRTLGDLGEFLAATQTTAFIVIQDDAVLYERYPNGFARESINTSFSVAKSFTSALVGMAIDDGRLRLDDPVTRYVPELLARGGDRLTIRHLLLMQTGVRYREKGWAGFSDDSWTYYAPDLRRLALGVTIEPERIGARFAYNNFHPLLLGLVLERATGQRVATLLQERIWKPLGMEFPASWSLDSAASGFEKMESGINARSIDFAKLGRLFLEDGAWNGRRIVSRAWVRASTSPPPAPRAADYYSERAHWAVFDRSDAYYKYLWWGYDRGGGDYDFFASGNHGQIVYVSPRRRLVIVRNGVERGPIDVWAELFFSAAARF